MKIKDEVYQFPCIGCVVEASCSKLCDKLEKDNSKVKDLFLKHRCCIDCGEEKLLQGPSGGMAQNVKCSSCGHKFNMGLPLFIDRI